MKASEEKFSGKGKRKEKRGYTISGLAMSLIQPIIGSLILVGRLEPKESVAKAP